VPFLCGLIEKVTIAQWTIQVSFQNRSEIYGLLRFIVELHAQGIRSNDARRLHAIDCMAHGHPFLLQWLYRQWALTSLQALPVFHQLLLVQIGPGFDEPQLASGERTRYQLDPIDTVDCHDILIVSVKMRFMVRCASFPVHADCDAEETADLWLESILA
jgi:hypothetical protein